MLVGSNLFGAFETVENCATNKLIVIGEYFEVLYHLIHKTVLYVIWYSETRAHIALTWFVLPQLKAGS